MNWLIGFNLLPVCARSCGETLAGDHADVLDHDADKSAAYLDRCIDWQRAEK